MQYTTIYMFNYIIAFVCTFARGQRIRVKSKSKEQHTNSLRSRKNCLLYWTCVVIGSWPSTWTSVQSVLTAIGRTHKHMHRLFFACQLCNLSLFIELVRSISATFCSLAGGVDFDFFFCFSSFQSIHVSESLALYLPLDSSPFSSFSPYLFGPSPATFSYSFHLVSYPFVPRCLPVSSPFLPRFFIVSSSLLLRFLPVSSPFPLRFFLVSSSFPPRFLTRFVFLLHFAFDHSKLLRCLKNQRSCQRSVPSSMWCHSIIVKHSSESTTTKIENDSYALHNLQIENVCHSVAH